MAVINWTEEAVRWLKDIHEYIAAENPGAALKVVEGIFDRAQILSSFPQMGHKYKTEPEGDVRILLYGHYRIAYLARVNQSIDILGVFHGAMEIERYLP